MQKTHLHSNTLPLQGKKKKKIYIYMDGVKEPQFQVLQGGIFSARVSLREERQCADLQPHKSGSRKKPPDFFFFIIHFCGPLNLHDDSEQRMVCFFP